MNLSECVQYITCSYQLISDGTFQALEQCTRIRGNRALTFLENPKYLDSLNNSAISCVICTEAIAGQLPPHIEGRIVSPTPKIAFYEIHNELTKQRELRPNEVDPSARISPLAYVAPYNVVIGKNVEIEPFVVINENTTIGDDSRICANTVIGAQGFSVVQKGSDQAFIVRDAGKTRIGKGVQIGSGCIIERGTLGYDETELSDFCMIDNAVTIGHGSRLGKRVMIAAETVISGNCRLGDRVWAGVNATISNAITIGDDARVSLGAVVTREVSSGETVTGNLAIPHKLFMENLKKSIRENV